MNFTKSHKGLKMLCKSKLILLIVAANIPNSSHAIPDSMLSVYTTMTGLIGGCAGALIAKARTANNYEALLGNKNNDTVAGFIAAGVACGAFGYWILKDRTATARYNQASNDLDQVERDSIFAAVPQNDGAHSYGQSKVQHLENLVGHADSLLGKALRDTSYTDPLQSNITSKQAQVTQFNKKTDHMRAHLNYDEANNILCSIERDSLVTIEANEKEDYVRNVQTMYVRQEFPVSNAFETLVKHDDAVRRSTGLLDWALTRSLNGSKLNSMIQAKQQAIQILNPSLASRMYFLKSHSAYTAEWDNRENRRLTEARIEAERAKANAAHVAAQAEQLKAEAALSQAKAEHERNAIRLAELNLKIHGK